MAGKPISMAQSDLIRRLNEKGYSIKRIARDTGISRNTIRAYLRAPEAGCGTDAHNGERYGLLVEHFQYAQTELTKTGVTRQLLWDEYKSKHADGYNYSQYCYYLREFMRHKEVTMHLEHAPGEETMIDFAGKKLHYVDHGTGEVIECCVFVSVLPSSGMIYCCAVHTQNTFDFVDCINSMLHYYGGVTKTIICDNLKTAVTRPSRYEPVFTQMCEQLSDHYASCFTAARPYKPRDKAMVEGAVRIVYQQVFAPLRNDVFDSLQSLNQAIRERINLLNDRPYKGSAYSRRQLFEQIEQAQLISLPAAPFILRKSITATVQRNYHIQLSDDKHYYSVPYSYFGKKVQVLFDNHTVEIYFERERIAIHRRDARSKAYHTVFEHMPSNHQHMVTVKGWTKQDLLDKAGRIGEHTMQAAEHILSSSIYAEQNYKSCYGMIMLQNKYGVHRVEAACKRALQGTRVNYTMIRNILLKGLDRQTTISLSNTLPDHENLRGAEHYK